MTPPESTQCCRVIYDCRLGGSLLQCDCTYGAARVLRWLGCARRCRRFDSGRSITMGLIRCVDCNAVVSDSAKFCVGCGRPMVKGKMPASAWSILFLAALVMAIVWACGRVGDSERGAILQEVPAEAGSAAPASNDVVGKVACWMDAAQKNESAQVCEPKPAATTPTPVKH